MSHVVEIGADAITVGLSVVIMLFIVSIARSAARMGHEVLVARLFLRQREIGRTVTIILIGLVVFMTSNLLELYGDIEHIDWVVNEIVEIGTMITIIVGLALFGNLVKVPSSRPAVSIPLEATEDPR